MDIEAERKKFMDEVFGVDHDDALFISKHMIGRLDPLNIRLKEPMDADTVLKYVFDFHILSNDRYGWLDRDGKLWGCAYASHERMCRFFGWDEKDLEGSGWVRISGYSPEYCFRRSAKQIAVMKRNGWVNDQIMDMVLGQPVKNFQP